MIDLRDPIGQAILDYDQDEHIDNIIVHSDLCEDDVMPVAYLFRTYEMMPDIEKKALSLCKGQVLEVGAGSGCHSKYLIEKGFETYAIDTSEGAVKYLKSKKINADQIAFYDLKNQKFDTILILMNGLGLAGQLKNLNTFLKHALSLLNPGGIIITDSTDIRYLYEDEEGGYWIDLNAKYPGEMQFKMEYKNHQSDWFNWVYVDFENLSFIADKAGLKADKIMEDDNFHYLATLKQK
jgi:SAM-dependent methyltransferase